MKELVSDPVALNSFLLVTSLIILFGYFCQSTSAFMYGHKYGILKEVFSLQKFVNMWLLVATIFFGPLLISWMSSIVELWGENMYELSASLVLSMLMIYITLEFSQLGSLNDKNRGWKTLLLVALFLDIACVVLVTAVTKMNVVETSLVYALASFSFFSSFMIILFAKIAGEGDGERA